MFLTSLYIKIRNWWDYLTTTKQEDDNVTIVINEIEYDSDSETITTLLPNQIMTITY